VTAHLDGKTAGLGSLQGNQPEDLNADCWSAHSIRGSGDNYTDYYCGQREWGCNAEDHMNIGLGTPNQAIISAVENTVTLTAVPAQVLMTNTSSVTNGTYAHESVG
jgi:hypothetical protein